MSKRKTGKHLLEVNDNILSYHQWNNLCKRRARNYEAKKARRAQRARKQRLKKKKYRRV